MVTHEKWEIVRMHINFNDHIFEVKEQELEGTTWYSLKDVEKGWQDSGGAGKRLDHWKVSPKYAELVLLTEIRVVSEEGRTGNTWGDREALIEYASHCSLPFRVAVRRAFIAASEGDGNAAVDIATAVMIPDELIEKEKRLRKQMCDLIAQLNDKNAFANYNKLASKVVSGYTPKQLTDGRHSTFQHCVKAGHELGVSAYLATLETIIMSLKLGLDYHKCAAMLQIQTTKNKSVFKV